MSPLIFLDLDDCLFQTLRKNPDTTGGVAALARDGAPLSYMTGRQRRLFDWLSAGAEVVPTTARSLDAVRRVTVPFRSWIICAFGGLIVTPEGQPDPDWRQRIAAAAGAAAAPLRAVLAGIEAAARRDGLDIRARLLSEDGLDLYISVKHNQEDAAELARLLPTARALLPAGWRLHHNDNNLAVKPGFLGKEHAVRWLIGRIGTGRLTLGFGDSLSDAPFMAACDFACVPVASQLGRHALAPEPSPELLPVPPA